MNLMRSERFSMYAMMLALLVSWPTLLQGGGGRREGEAKQLLAVRGEITSISRKAKGALAITVRPARDFRPVTIQAHENDLVGPSVSRLGSQNLLGLLAGETSDSETLTAAELMEGDLVSVIFDPGGNNRALELYLH